MERWAGKVAVVTGASSGIGEALTKDLVGRGLKVAGLARRYDRLKSLESETAGSKGEMKALECDITKEEDIARAFKWIEENWGPAQILINNAGIFASGSPSDMDTKLLKKAVDTHMVGLTVCTKEFLNLMKTYDIDDGHIITVNSIAPHYASHFLAIGSSLALNTSIKCAVKVLVEALRREMSTTRSKVRITCLSPGLVNTDMPPKGVLENLPFLEVEDICQTVNFVLSLPTRVNISDVVIQPVGEWY